jgi:pimeloyl-ACP methyl ester carboxylesterase
MDPRRTNVHLPHATVSALEWRPASESGLPILLLHGGGADDAELSWSAVGPALAAAGHRVIAADHPGFGRSARAGWSLTQERLVRHVGELVDGLGLDDYAVAGLSLGGGMTVGHLLDQPGRARSAVLLGCYGLMPRLADGLSGRITQFGTFFLLRSGLLAAMTRSYARNASLMERGLRELVRNPQARTPELVDAVLAEAATGEGLETFGEWQRDQVLWNRLRTVYTSQLPSITTPTLLVHGDEDSGVPLARIRTAAGLLPAGSLVTVHGAGHWVQRDRPDLVIPAMLDHLRRSGDAQAPRP